MSSLLSFTMPSTKKEKHYANSRARRHSEVVISPHSSKKSKKDKDKDEKEKDTDSESVSSSTASSADTVVVPPPPEPKKCPLRFILAGMMEPEDEEGIKRKGCPLRRVQLWHTIPLCLLAIINLLLVILALLGLAGYRIGMALQEIALTLFKTDLDNDQQTESLIDLEDVDAVVSEKQ